MGITTSQNALESPESGLKERKSCAIRIYLFNGSNNSLLQCVFIQCCICSRCYIKSVYVTDRMLPKNGFFHLFAGDVQNSQ